MRVVYMDEEFYGHCVRKIQLGASDCVSWVSVQWVTA